MIPPFVDSGATFNASRSHPDLPELAELFEQAHIAAINSYRGASE